MKKATNSTSMRIKNEKIILSIINKGPISRADIAKKTGLTKAAVSIIVDDLKRRNIIIEKNGKSDSVGRNPVMLFLNDKAFYIVGINITRHNITLGITDLGGNVIEEDAFEMCPPNEAFAKIKKIFDDKISAAGIDTDKIYKLSVVTPGPVDVSKGMILNPPNFKEWHNVEIVKKLEMATGLEVVFANISSATAMAEKYFGAARDTETFLSLRVDEGIGAGIMIGDVLFKGPCEIGHTSIKYDGIKCECGNSGCLEKYAPVPYILENTSYKTWQEAVDNGDDDVLEKEAQYISSALISANNIFGFEKIVLCGDLTYKPQRITELVEKNIEQKMLYNNSPKICAGQVKSRHLIASAVAVNDIFT